MVTLAQIINSDRVKVLSLLKLVKVKRTSSWYFNEECFTIEFIGTKGVLYQVDLDRCNSPWDILDWICQIKDKSWCDSNCLAEFISLLDFLCNGLQYYMNSDLVSFRMAYGKMLADASC